MNRNFFGLLASSCGLLLLSGGVLQVEALSLYDVRSETSSAKVPVGGIVAPKTSVTLSSQMPGRVEFIAGEEGDQFAQDTVLVRIDDESLQAARAAALAKRKQLEIEAYSAWVQYNREMQSPRSQAVPSNSGMGMPMMLDKFMTSPMTEIMGHSNPGLNRNADLRVTYNGMMKVRAMIDEVDANLKKLDSNFRNTKSVAPFAGSIIKKFVEVGNPVQPGMPLLDFADLTKLEVHAYVPQRIALGLKEGIEVQAKIDNHPIDVILVHIHPIVDPVRHTVKMEFSLPAGNQSKAGTYSEILLPDTEAAKHTIIKVPKKSLMERSGLPQVFVVRNGKADLRLIRVGEEIDAQHVSVLTGLQDGDQVVVNPPITLKPGDNVP